MIFLSIRIDAPPRFLFSQNRVNGQLKVTNQKSWQRIGLMTIIEGPRQPYCVNSLDDQLYHLHCSSFWDFTKSLFRHHEDSLWYLHYNLARQSEVDGTILSDLNPCIKFVKSQTWRKLIWKLCFQTSQFKRLVFKKLFFMSK